MGHSNGTLEAGTPLLHCSEVARQRKTEVATESIVTCTIVTSHAAILLVFPSNRIQTTTAGIPAQLGLGLAVKRCMRYNVLYRDIGKQPTSRRVTIVRSSMTTTHEPLNTCTNPEKDNQRHDWTTSKVMPKFAES